MYDEFTDVLAVVEDMDLIWSRVPTFWDTDTAEQAYTDPDEYQSWDVAIPPDGWDDPAVAIEVREQLPDETRLVPLASTPVRRPQVHCIDDCLTDRALAPEELLLLALEFSADQVAA